MTQMQVSLLQRIVHDPAILSGKAVVKGTRVPVALVLAKLSANPDLNEILADYPRLTVDDVRACLEYGAMIVEREEQGARVEPVSASLGA